MEARSAVIRGRVSDDVSVWPGCDSAM